jgi:hypothetical protein
VRNEARQRPLMWHAGLAREEGIDLTSVEGRRWTVELRRYRLAGIEHGQAEVVRRGDIIHAEHVGSATQLGNPGCGAWWVVADPLLYGEFWPWVDGMSSIYRSRQAAVSALVRSSIRWYLEHPGWEESIVSLRKANGVGVNYWSNTLRSSSRSVYG